MRRTTLPTFIVLLSLGGIAGCIGDATAPASHVGTLSFTYSGAEDGHVSANGDLNAVPYGADINGYSWANGLKPSGSQEFQITANAPSDSAGRGNFIAIEGHPVGTGTYPLAGDPNNLIALGVKNGANGETFPFVAGSVTITSTDNGHLQGTFNGTAVSQSNDTLHVINGQFDVVLQAP